MSNFSKSQGKSVVLLVEFSEAYSFRKTFEYLKQTNIDGNLIFSQKEILYSELDSEGTVLNNIQIKPSDLTRYEYNSENPFISIGFTISHLCQYTKNIGKKDTLLIYMLPNNPLVYIKIDTSNAKISNRNSVYILTPKNREDKLIEPPDYIREENNPNCTIPISEFSKMCTSMSSIKCSYVTINVLSRGVIFKGMMEGNVTGRIDHFGNCDDNKTKLCLSHSHKEPQLNKEISESTSPNQISQISQISEIDQKKIKLEIRPQEEIKIRVKSSTIKALSKLNNLTHGGVIKIYGEKSNPIKLIANIGSYGTLTIFLQNST